MKFSHTHTNALSGKAAQDGPKAVQMFEFALLTLQVKSLLQLLGDNPHAEKVAHTFSSVGAFAMDALNISPEEFDPVLRATETAVLADTKDTFTLNKAESPAEGSPRIL